MSASVWEPGANLVVVDAESTNLSQVFIATLAQTGFTLTDFSYTVSTGSIAVYRGGQRLILDTDWEETSSTGITLLGISLEAGEVIEVVAVLGSASVSAIAAAQSAANAAQSAIDAANSAASINVANLVQRTNNLSDLANAATARGNLGLGDAATKTIGTGAGQVPTADQVPGLVPTPAQATVVGAFRNLQLSANGTSANVSVGADELVVENASNAYQTLRNVSLTINTAGAGANGLDIGSLAGSTWYAIWVIWNGASTAGLISLSATAPTLPSGYTHKARVGWIRTDASGNKYPLGFVQMGRRVQYKISAGSNLTAYPSIFSGSNGSVLTATGIAAAVPPTASVVNVLLGFSSSPAVNTTLFVCSNSAGNYANSFGGISQGGSGSTAALLKTDVLLESQNIYISSNSSVGLVNVNGWEDNQ